MVSILDNGSEEAGPARAEIARDRRSMLAEMREENEGKSSAGKGNDDTLDDEAIELFRESDEE